MDTDDNNFNDLDGNPYVGSAEEVATNTASTGDAGNESMTSNSTESLDHDLSDHSGFKHKHGHFHHPLESRYSGTDSESWHDTQGSVSKGTSGRASTVSTQSITLKEFKDLFANTTSGRVYTFNDAP